MASSRLFATMTSPDFIDVATANTATSCTMSRVLTADFVIAFSAAARVLLSNCLMIVVMILESPVSGLDCDVLPDAHRLDDALRATVGIANDAQRRLRVVRLVEAPQQRLATLARCRAPRIELRALQRHAIRTLRVNTD